MIGSSTAMIGSSTTMTGNSMGHHLCIVLQQMVTSSWPLLCCSRSIDLQPSSSRVSSNSLLLSNVPVTAALLFVATDLQMVNMSLRLLSKPSEDNLSNIFKVCLN
jgi:hypothetical protein